MRQLKYKHIKIDMDYSTDPVWVSNTGIQWLNDSLSEYESVLSKELLHGLEVYRSLWEISNWSKYKGPSDECEFSIGYEESLSDLISEMEVKLAVQMYEELTRLSSEYHVYYSVYSEGVGYRQIEVGNDKPEGIYPTLVG